MVDTVYGAELPFLATLMEASREDIQLCGVPGECFDDPKATALYAGILAASGKHSDIKVADVIAELRESGRLTLAGGEDYLVTLHVLFGDRDRKAAKRELIRFAANRRTVEATSKANRLALAGQDFDASQVLEEAVTDVRRILGSDGKPPYRNVRDHVNAMLARLVGLADGTIDYPYQAKLGPLTRPLGYPHPGALVVVGGYSHSGKSFLMQWIEAQYAAVGLRTVRLSLEDADPVNEARLCAEIGGIDYSEHYPDQGKVSSMIRTLQSGMPKARLDKQDRWVHSPESRDLDAILRDFDRACIEYQARVVFVDYAQLIRVARGLDARHTVATATGALKERAMQRGVTLYLASQLRKPDGSSTGEPGPHDLKDASELHSAADVVILSWPHAVGNERWRLARMVKDKLTGSYPFFRMVHGPGGVVTRLSTVEYDMSKNPREVSV